MPAVNVYLSKEEYAWVKRQREGLIREWVQNIMAKYPDKVPPKENDGR
jgi:hypothetical protein